MTESSSDKVDDALEAFITHLKRMNILLTGVTETMEERNFLMLPILPHLHPEHREKLQANSDKFGQELTDLQEVFELMGEDMSNFGDGLDGYIDEILDMRKELNRIRDENE